MARYTRTNFTICTCVYKDVILTACTNLANSCIILHTHTHLVCQPATNVYVHTHTTCSLLFSCLEVSDSIFVSIRKRFQRFNDAQPGENALMYTKLCKSVQSITSCSKGARVRYTYIYIQLPGSDALMYRCSYAYR